MTSWCRKVVLMTEFTVRALLRERVVVAVLALAILSATGSWWWRDFNFGEQEGRFLLNFGFSVQALGAIVLAIAGVGQLATKHRESGLLPVLLGRGIAPSAIVTGEVLGVVTLVGVFVVGTAVVMAGLLAMTGWAIPIRELAIVSIVQVIKSLVIVGFTRWFSAISQNLLFIVVASSLFTVIGHLKPWTDSLGGLAWVLTRPVPNLAWLGEAGWSGSLVDGTAALVALGYAVMFTMGFIIFSARFLSRNEY